MDKFDSFWALYPRKVSKKMALKAWQKLDLLEQTSALDAIVKHKLYWEIRELAIDYIPHPATWLNQGRWDDELVMPASKEAFKNNYEKVKFV